LLLSVSLTRICPIRPGLLVDPSPVGFAHFLFFFSTSPLRFPPYRTCSGGVPRRYFPKGLQPILMSLFARMFWKPVSPGFQHSLVITVEFFFSQCFFFESSENKVFLPPLPDGPFCVRERRWNFVLFFCLMAKFSRVGPSPIPHAEGVFTEFQLPNLLFVIFRASPSRGAFPFFPGKPFFVDPYSSCFFLVARFFFSRLSCIISFPFKEFPFYEHCTILSPYHPFVLLEFRDPRCRFFFPYQNFFF